MNKQLFLATLSLCLSLNAEREMPEHLQKIYDPYPPYKAVDFDVSMRTEQYPEAIVQTQRIVGVEGELFLKLCKTLCELYDPAKIPVKDEPTIPKVIHQIWLGGEVPEAFKQYMQTWIDNHLGRGWKYKLWTDKDVETFDLYNREFYEQSDNYGVKSDILKWEIIYQFGGVYVDTDFECLLPLDFFHYTYDFYVGIQPLDALYVNLGAALFGAKPGSPILKHCIETIKDDWHKPGAPGKTGPVHFTRSFYQTAGRNGLKEIALPAHYFYPLGCRENYADRDVWKDSGAYAVHWWSKSWMPAHYRPKEFRQLNNDDSTINWNG